jgi:hypothetical protein
VIVSDDGRRRNRFLIGCPVHPDAVGLMRGTKAQRGLNGHPPRIEHNPGVIPVGAKFLPFVRGGDDDMGASASREAVNSSTHFSLRLCTPGTTLPSQ